MSWSVYVPYLLVMALITYLVRMLPLTIFRKPIRSRFFRSFLHYVPYAVLSAMTIPGVLYSTGYEPGGDVRLLLCAVAGLAVAVPLAWRGKSLLTVAVAACLGVAAALGLFLLTGQMNL